jgi:hypothetical protein
MAKIDWGLISDEQFQELCVKLLFREGYRNITPLGSRGVKEDGRDAVSEIIFRESSDKKIVAFQFKRWTIDYSDASIRSKVKKELDEKILPSGRQIDEYILVTCHSLVKLNNWFVDELSQRYAFPVRYFEKSWLENRLESESQDLRRSFFGIDIERHSAQSLLQSCKDQTEKAIRSVGIKYIADLYVERPIENEVKEFLKSDRSCFLIVDRSGQGKTNLLCHLAEVLRAEIPVMLIFAAKTITKEHDLAMHIVEELGYSSSPGTRWQSGLDDIIKISRKAEFTTLILIDGISENSDIVKMKKALRELLVKYGNEKNIKFVFTCRDSFWPRFRAEFPDEYIYRKRSQGDFGDGDRLKEVAQFLGDWSDTEFETASLLYTRYFDIQFTLSENAKDHCKYPLLFRLFCETYNHLNVGFVNALPFRKVFNEYFDVKIQRIVDNFGIDFSPDRIRASILKIRQEMWLSQDANSLDRDQVDLILRDFNLMPQDAVLSRMCDEGIFLETSTKNEDRVRFAFDELSDYVLFTVFSEEYLKEYPTDIECIDNMCRILMHDDHPEALMAEKFLILLARNTEDPIVLSHLLDNILMFDLSIFSQCAWQRLVISDFSEMNDVEKVRMFGERLIYLYGAIIERYFSAIKLTLDPFVGAPGILGLTATAAPKIRELSYSYKMVNASESVLDIRSVDRFPTWSMSFDDHKLHDPEHGIFVSNVRNFPDGRVLRSLDFEWHSPFRGVSLHAPDRVALYDIWTEVAYILDKHQILEPRDLLVERANSLSKDLPKDLINLQDPEVFVAIANDIESSFPKDSRERLDFQNKASKYLYYLTVLETNSFEELLPSPDLSVVKPEVPLQFLYSDQGLANYLQVLFSKFIQMYSTLIDKNFMDISQYLNLYQQIPFSSVFLVNSFRSYVRVFVFPEEKDSETELRVYLLKPGEGDNISDGDLRVNDNKPSDEAVREVLSKLGKKNRLVTPIDIVFPMKELFKENPINNLTIKWIKSELAQLLRTPFNWPSV